MIRPTIGRIVLYWENGAAREVDEQPRAAIVLYVHNDREVNLAVFPQGLKASEENRHGYLDSVPLLQEGDEQLPSGPYAEWMPYQKSVAKGEIPPVLHAAPSPA